MKSKEPTLGELEDQRPEDSQPMTLEDAILHCRNLSQSGFFRSAPLARQLADWLSELKQYRARAVRQMEDGTTQPICPDSKGGDGL